MRNKQIAVYAGTFDPITLGHVDIIVRAAQIFENTIVAIAKDSKKSTHFSTEERAEMIQGEIDRLELKNVSVQVFSGLLVDFVKEQDSRIIVRGLRALADFEYEFQMAYMNHKLHPDIETIFLPATENGNFISSSFVNEVARLGGSVDGFVSPLVVERIKKRYELR